MKSPKFWTVVVLLLFAFFVLNHRGDADNVPASEPLSNLPETIGNWTAHDIPLDSATLDVLGKGDFLNRVYLRPMPAAQQASLIAPVYDNAQAISLFIAYFPTQRTGQTMHSPQHCLPGAGWTFDSQKYTTLQDIHDKTYHVGEYVISNGEQKQFVIYWYQAHGRSIPNEYKAKAYMVADAIRMNRTDGALVRVITPILPTETLATAKARAVHFTSQMVPFLPRFIPN
ncbi:exosortase C-terminal domain/associated protein EpsI [Edaphobacter sp.]|uniref:exosortase C-terminal domain/associated protein EpsI n=1 Tax=Edaphobacter sp. TaxID=1934404 RepID=UPI002DB6B811|nr:exosortase C-terminal domain/associated protein EpsI [Edaphobacter sp.]HEU5339638.1 EpsI family protein [Edaphobacter sp.]